MFFERFGVQQSELQRLLDAANLAVPTSLDEQDLRLIQDDELIGMLNTNEPPAIKFVSTRIKAIVNLATRLPANATKQHQQATLAALHLLTSGTPAVAKAILSDPECFIEMLCKPLARLSLETIPTSDRIGNAGYFASTALDSAAFDVEPSVAIDGALTLPMHLCMILSSSLRATATNPATLISDSLRYVQLSTSGARSAMQEHISNHLSAHSADIGAAAAHALGVAKHSQVLACEMFSLSSAVVNSFGATILQRIATLWATGTSVSRREACLKITAYLCVLESVAPLFAPGAKEGEHFCNLVYGLFATEEALQIIILHAFSDYESIATSTRVAAVRFITTVLLQSPKWRDRWPADMFYSVALRIGQVSSTPEFHRALRFEAVRREEQLRAVELVSIAAQCFSRWTTVQSSNPSPEPLSFDKLRDLLPTAQVFEIIRELSIKSPSCGLLHCTVEKAVFALTALVGTAALSQSMTHVNVQAVASSVLLEELKAHVLATQVHSVLPGHSIMITYAILDVVEEHAFPDDPEVAQFKAFVAERIFPTVLASAPGEGVMASNKDALKWFCMPSLKGDSSVSSLGISGSFGASSPSRATRVVVDEVDLETIKRQATAVSFEHNIEPAPAESNAFSGSNDSTSPSATATTASFESVTSSGSPRCEDILKTSSKKFSIKRKTTSLVSSPSGHHPLHNDDHENPLSLTSSLNESVHSNMEPRSSRSSFEVASKDDDDQTRFISGPRAGDVAYRVSPPRQLKPRADAEGGKPTPVPDLFSVDLQPAPSHPPTNVNLFANWPPQ